MDVESLTETDATQLFLTGDRSRVASLRESAVEAIGCVAEPIGLSSKAGH